MARLKNIKTGVIVGVADEKVERLGTEWEPVKAEKPKTETPAPKSDKK